MSDLHLNFSTQPHERPGDDDAREARHQVLATLLGAYADGELPPETASQIDAHLLGCARCRREVELHSVVRSRLSREPVETASSALRARIVQELEQARQSASHAAPMATRAPAWWTTTRARSVMAIVVVVISVAFGVLRLRGAQDDVQQRTLEVRVADVPLMSAVLEDYRAVTAGDLPGRARDLDAVRAAVPFPVEPLHGGAARLLAAWSTDLQGEPAAVLAYRWHDKLVLEYLVAEPVFFRYPGLRTPIAAGALITTSSGAQGALAWAAPESGAILVGDVAPAALLALRVGGTGH